MAIRLASAIGEQREPTSILSGVDDAINRTGDAIQAANQRKAAEEAKKRDAALQAAMSIDTDIDALPEDNKRFKQQATPLIGEVFKLFANGASPSAISAKSKEVEGTLLTLKRRYESDKADWLKIMADKANNKDKKDYSEAEAYLTGIEKKEMPMSQPISKSQQEGGYGVPTEEEMLGGIEVVDVRERPEYWNASAEEREKIAPAGPYAEVLKRAKDITGNFDDAIDAYTGGKFDPQSRFTNLQDVLKAGGLDKQQVIVDNEGIAKEKSAFISSFGSDIGGVKARQYWNTLTTLAAKRGREAGLEGDSLKQFVELNVKDVAGKDFDRRVQQDIEKTKIKKIDEDPDKEGKGRVINNGNGMFSNGNTSMNKTEEITPYVQRKYAAKESQIKKEIERLKNSTNPTDQQTVKGYEKSLSDLERLKASEAKDHIKYSNAKAKDDQYVTYGVVSGKDKNGNDIKENISFRPEDFYERNGIWYMAGEEKKEIIDLGKNVVTYLDREIPLDENNYQKLITEDRLVIPLLEKHGIKPSGQKQSGASAPKATADASSNYEANKKAYLEEFGLEESDLTEEDINYLKSK